MTTRDDIIREARARLGIPYGLPPGPGETDCSLYVLDVFKAAGIPFPPGVRTAEQERQASIPIGWDDVLPGDLLYFEHTYEPDEAPGPDGHVASHIGISLGAGTHRMLNAVEPVSTETNIGTTYWQGHLLEARRHPALVAAAPPAPAAPGGSMTVATMPRGVDVASYQGRPDWSAVAASGLTFAFTKATESVDYLNPTFGYNWSGIKGAGLARGAYHFAQPDANSPEAEADWFARHVLALLEAGDLLALDLEAGSGDLSDWTLRWLRRVEALVGYTSPGFAQAHNLARLPEIGQYGLWLANWQASLPTAPAPWDLVAFWQYSDAEQVPGIAGAVDGDRFNGPADRIRMYGKPGTAPAPVPVPPAYSVGVGILAAMAAHGDRPATDEMFTKRAEKDEWSEAFGQPSGARYVYVTALGRTLRFAPAA
jgi:lysozyme